MNVEHVLNRQVYRGELLHFLDDPDKAGDDAWEYIVDALLVIDDGLISAMGPAESLLSELPQDTEITHYPDGLMVPGFVDAHTHLPQLEMIGSGGAQLLDWLEGCVFPVEEKFSDANHCRDMASVFIDELLRNGTTTAMVFGSVHPESVNAFFSQAQSRGLRMICGKVLMDRHVPDGLQDSADQGYEESRELIERWHGTDRLQYAVTPRFAPSCSHEQLTRAGELLKAYPDVYLQTHLSESVHEVSWVAELFPDSEHYLEAYDQYGLLRKRSVFAHGIHLCDDEFQRLSQAGSSLAYCPSSNLFLGSGLFNFSKATSFDCQVGLGTDVGAGTSFSLLQTMGDAYKVQQLRGETLDILSSFYMATLGGARALDLDDHIGNFLVGKEADFIVLDYNATPLLQLRMQRTKSVQERLFLFGVLGDDRSIAATHILGQKVAGTLS